MNKAIIILMVFASQLVFSKTVTVAHIKDAKGNIEKLQSDNKELLMKTPLIEHVNLSESTWLCNNKETVMGLTLFLEKELELDTMIKTFNPDYGLTKNQIVMLGYLPDCKEFRFRLHVISKLQSGYKFEKIENKEI